MNINNPLFIPFNLYLGLKDTAHLYPGLCCDTVMRRLDCVGVVVQLNPSGTVVKLQPCVVRTKGRLCSGRGG